MSRSCRVPKKRTEIEEIIDEPKQTVQTYHKFMMKNYTGLKETIEIAKKHITNNPYLYLPWRMPYETPIDSDQGQ